MRDEFKEFLKPRRPTRETYLTLQLYLTERALSVIAKTQLVFPINNKAVIRLLPEPNPLLLLVTEFALLTVLKRQRLIRHGLSSNQISGLR